MAPISSDTFRQFDRLTFVSHRAARAGTGGEHNSRRRAPSTDFVDYRPYQSGDDFRRVDWNVYGRLGSLQVKLTEARERLDVLLMLDCSSSMAYGTPDKLTFASQLVAALAYVGAARADRVRVVCLGAPASRFGPFSRRTRVVELLHQLQSLVAVGAIDLNADMAASISQGDTANTLVIVVSDLLTVDGVAGGLDALAWRVSDVAVVHVISPDELEPRLAGEVRLVDAESGAAHELGVSQATLAAYSSRLAAWLEQREADSRRRGQRYIRVRTDTPLEAVIMDDLRRGHLLR